ncbi:MAG: SGNH/GDSL hydrolase family protein [Gemmataceae bacterium]|nr:SGNH/GDSL hydrolase family protein [Gemmataceae bacterium]
MKRRKLASWLLALALIGLGAEVGARLDDWACAGVPLLASPNRGRDLTLHDEHGFHGQPNGRFKKWKLNSLGFRSPEASPQPEPGMKRIVVLGASETFGLYETEGMEYPAQLEAMLKKHHPNVEVQNAAMAGMSLASMKPYWEQWASKAEPQYVIIYPSPMLYLTDKAPKPPSSEIPALEPLSMTERIRIAPRIRDGVRQAEWLKPLRQLYFQWKTRTSLAHHSEDGWIWSEPPADRLEQFSEDLRGLVRSIRAKGAVPMLITHANRSPSPPTSEYLGELEAMRAFYPRASPQVIAEFEVLGREAVKRIAREEVVRCIDAASKMTDDREAWFADEVHFTDAGARRFADIVAGALEPVLTGR